MGIGADPMDLLEKELAMEIKKAGFFISPRLGLEKRLQRFIQN